jgi:hypothetical protein
LRLLASSAATREEEIATADRKERLDTRQQ